MFIKEEATRKDPILQARLLADQHTYVIARHPELIKETIGFKGTTEGTVPDLRTERGGVVESGLSPKYVRPEWKMN